jgi:ferredoxin-NADP reductase
MKETQVTVSDVRTVGPETYVLEFESPPEFTAQPGQFVQVTATVGEEEISSFYSICSASTDKAFEITFDVGPESELGQRLSGLSAGAAVTIDGPFGNTYYEGDEESVVVAGGPGIGPAIGIGERALEEGNDVAVVYHDETPVHKDRLVDLSANGASVMIVKNGLTEAVSQAIDAIDGEIFVYGYEDFIDEATDALNRVGVNPDDVNTSSFG